MSGIHTCGIDGVSARWYIFETQVHVLSVAHADGSRQTLPEQPTLGEACDQFDDYPRLWAQVRRVVASMVH